MSSSESLRNGSTPTVLLVHGAFADASSWAGVIAQLQTVGIDAVAPANPLRGLSADARYIASVAEEVDGPTMLVGHSYGGAVITVAAALARNAVGLVYVTAFALDEGESVLDVSARFSDGLLTAALRPAVCPDGDGGSIVELYIDRDEFPTVFAADLPADVAAVAAATQRPIAATAFEEQASAAAWKTLQCWYVVATADRVTHPDAQRFMATRAAARVLEVDASHAIATSQPALIANQIHEAVRAARQSGSTASALHATTPIIGHTESELT
jgi:pimeloyl-ACP methyl ester carboxylesterase